ncbi:MAG: DUF1549 domain-containing protein [Saprospiraceae bacterium]|nr:DUF1549 domain-containing protein [Saprospiraceae bacterium]
MDEFLKNPSDEYLQSIEDKLLQSDAYAERMTMEWLDVARYADSHGYHADGWKSMYPWRDWVIKALKKTWLMISLEPNSLPEIYCLPLKNRS